MNSAFKDDYLKTKTMSKKCFYFFSYDSCATHDLYLYAPYSDPNFCQMYHFTLVTVVTQGPYICVILNKLNVFCNLPLLYAANNIQII